MLVSVTRQEKASHAPLNPCAVRAAEQALEARGRSAQPLVTVAVAVVAAASAQAGAARSLAAVARSLAGVVPAALQAATRSRLRIAQSSHKSCNQPET